MNNEKRHKEEALDEGSLELFELMFPHQDEVHIHVVIPKGWDWNKPIVKNDEFAYVIMSRDKEIMDETHKTVWKMIADFQNINAILSGEEEFQREITKVHREEKGSAKLLKELGILALIAYRNKKGAPLTITYGGICPKKEEEYLYILYCGTEKLTDIWEIFMLFSDAMQHYHMQRLKKEHPNLFKNRVKNGGIRNSRSKW